jgi:hypothetical protein
VQHTAVGAGRPNNRCLLQQRTASNQTCRLSLLTPTVTLVHAVLTCMLAASAPAVAAVLIRPCPCHYTLQACERFNDDALPTLRELLGCSSADSLGLEVSSTHCCCCLLPACHPLLG